MAFRSREAKRSDLDAGEEEVRNRGQVAVSYAASGSTSVVLETGCRCGGSG